MSMMIKRSAVDKSYEKLLLRNPYRQFWATVQGMGRFVFSDPILRPYPAGEDYGVHDFSPQPELQAHGYHRSQIGG